MPATLKFLIWLAAIACFIVDCIRESGQLRSDRKGHFWMSLGWALFIFPFVWDAADVAFTD